MLYEDEPLPVIALMIPVFAAATAGRGCCCAVLHSTCNYHTVPSAVCLSVCLWVRPLVTGVPVPVSPFGSLEVP